MKYTILISSGKIYGRKFEFLMTVNLCQWEPMRTIENFNMGIYENHRELVVRM